MIIGELKRYNSISRVEVAAAHAAVHEGVMSGFLGGQLRGGRWVRELEDKWCETFKVKHAIACNSATSGLLAACRAAGVTHDTCVSVPAMTMSATAAAPALLGATIDFSDVEPDYFCISKDHAVPDVLIATNLFGQPSSIGRLTDIVGVTTIEDNAQAIFAMNHDRYAGTIADIGVFSLNVHKHIQCGEGGICVTDDDDLANAMRRFINHGEIANGHVGLNLRMTELTAAVAFAQLVRGPRLVQQRVEIAEAVLAAIGPIPGIQPPKVRPGCTHVYYTIPFLMTARRTEFCKGLVAQSVPVIEGYVAPLYRLPAFKDYARPCPVAEVLHDERLFYYENCAWDPTVHQIKDIGDAFKQVAEAMKL